VVVVDLVGQVGLDDRTAVTYRQAFCQRLQVAGEGFHLAPVLGGVEGQVILREGARRPRLVEGVLQ
jgi:hypothetical protein